MSFNRSAQTDAPWVRQKKELEAFLQADIVARYCGQLYYNGLLHGIGSRQLIDNCWLVSESTTR